MIKDILKYCNTEKNRIVAMIACQCVTTSLTIIVPLIFAAIIDCVLEGNRDEVVRFFLIYVVLEIVTVFMNYLIQTLDVKASKNVNFRVREKLLHYLFHIPAYDNDIPQGRMYSLVTADAQSIYEFLSVIISTFFTVVTVIGVGIVTVVTDWRLTLILFVPYPFVIMINRHFRRGIKERTKILLSRNDVFISMLEGVIGNIPGIQNQCGVAKITSAVNSESGRGRDAAVSQGRLQNLFHLFIDFTGFGGNIVFTLCGLGFVLAGALTMGDFVAFTSYSKSLSSSLDGLFSLKTNMQPLLVSIERVLDVERLYNDSLVIGQGREILTQRVESIELSHVTLAYGQNTILDDVSLSLRKGEIVGVCGSNGSGKTTLARLLTNLQRPTAGRILINGTPVEQYDFFSLTGHMDYVGANGSVYCLSVLDNILLAGQQRDEVFEDNCRLLKISDFAANLENGLDTVVDGSVGLSTGQIQKINLARALQKQSEVLVLDETMASLDEETRRLLTDRLKELAADRLIVIISHSQADYDICDRVYCVNDSKVEQIHFTLQNDNAHRN